MYFFNFYFYELYLILSQIFHILLCIINFKDIFNVVIDDIAITVNGVNSYNISLALSLDIYI